MTRPTLSLDVEQLAQIRNTRQVVFYLARCIEQRDQQLADGLARTIAEQDRLSQKIDALADQLTAIGIQLAAREHAESAAWLESHGCVVQANGVLRDLRSDVAKLPHLVANATALAVGAALAPAAAPAPAPIILIQPQADRDAA